MKLNDACGRALAAVATADERIWVIDGDLADSDGALPFAQAHPGRFVMAGIAEQSMVSMAAGMASCGLRPWVFSFASFVCYRAYDQLRVSVCQARQPVTVVGSHSGGCTNRNGKTHAALNDIAIMASLPDMHVWAPATPADVVLAVDRIVEEGAPAYLRLPRTIVPALPGAADCRWMTAPSPTVIVSTGLATHFALAAHERLLQWGIDAGVLHCLRVRPLPALVEAVVASAEHVMVVDDHYTFGGLGSLLHPLPRRAPLQVFGWPAEWAGQSGSDAEVLDRHGLAAGRLAEAMAGCMTAQRLR